MDQKENLILLHGEIRTQDIQACICNSKTQKYDITFSGGKTYHYGADSVEWIRNPKALDPAHYRISQGSRRFFHITQLLEFRGKQTYWYLGCANGFVLVCRKKDLTIRVSSTAEKTVADRLSYLSRLAAISELKTEDGEALLSKQYARMDFLEKDCALNCYLDPKKHPVRTWEKQPLIFPFGGNASQFAAVENALSSQLSVIQGPPGTGKTQTILNILANLLIRGKTAEIVSNNNSATDNILEKLASPQNKLDFLAAPLGKAENKQAFLEGQKEKYPRFPGWKKSPQEQQALKKSIAALSSELSEGFSKQETVARNRRELMALETEAQHFSLYCQQQNLVLSGKKPGKSLKSGTILRLLHCCERSADREKGLTPWTRLRCRLLCLLPGKSLNDPGTAARELQQLYYLVRQKELKNDIQALKTFLNVFRAKEKMDELTALSRDCLRAVLYDRFGGKEQRPRFTPDSLRKNPEAFLAEYPIVLSTTFSARSSLKDVQYDYVIMDEASQVDITTGALALSCGENAVVVGDLRQLPNVVSQDQKQRSDAIFAESGLPEGYAFSRNSFLRSLCTVLPDIPQTLLKEHYRCHPKIIEFCNQKFYHGQLVIMTEDHGEPDTLRAICTVPGNHCRGHLNQRQIDVTLQEVLPGLSDTAPGEIGVITPYRDQADALSAAIRRKKTEVDTVHKFQGREKDAIVLLTVDDRVTDFSDDPYLLNVAVSRAKKKLCLVVSGNEQPQDSNIRDLLSYIRYQNFEVADSRLYSVFDMLYQPYTQARLDFLRKHRRISRYDSENLLYGALCDLLRSLPDTQLGLICHQSLRLMFRDFRVLTEEERIYAQQPGTHVDFLIYNRITRLPLLGIEVDGVAFHKAGTRQAQRDTLKNSIFRKYGLPLLRLPTNGSGELEKIRQALTLL